MENTFSLLGVCGLYCGACYHYRAAFAEGKHIIEQAIRQGRSMKGFICMGCRSQVLCIHPGCSRCEIRACAEGKNLIHCGLCSEFPCDRLKDFRGDGRLHHQDVLVNLVRLIEIGPEPWLVEQSQRWECDCGAHFSWYDEFCHTCGAPLASYSTDSRKSCLNNRNK
jgi:hypothetical protein